MIDCKDCSLGHMVAMIKQRDAEILHLRMYAPARRATTNTEPAKQINPTDWAAWGMETPDNDGLTPYQEVSDEA